MARVRKQYAVNAASADDVEQFAATLSDEFLQCRELGHVWRPHTAAIADGYYERRLRCPRCKCVREEQISMRGEVLRRQMHYPDGYLAAHIGRIVGDGRGQLRIASITRSVGHTDEVNARRARKATPRKTTPRETGASNA